MKKYILVIIATLISNIISRTPYKSKGITVLDSSNLEDFIKSNVAVLVLFYNSSNESKDYKEDFYSAAKILNRLTTPPLLAKIKIQKQEEYKKFSIQKAPSLVYYIEGNAHPVGQLSDAQVVQVVQRVESLVIPVRNQEEINMLTKEASPYTINLMYVGTSGDSEFKQFLDFKDTLKNVRFAICESEICEKKYPKALQSFVLLKNYLPKKEVIFDRSYKENEFTKERITEWVDQNTEAYVMKFTERFLQVGFGKKGLAFVIWRSDTSKHVKDYNKLLTNLAKKANYTDFAFYASDIDGDEHTKKASQYFLNTDLTDKSKLPIVAIYDNRSGELKSFRYKSDISINDENIKAFIQDFREEKIEKDVLSQNEKEAEEEQIEVGNKIAYGDSRVRALVRNNFYREVIEPKLDVFVMFYTSWCEHCHEIMPLYENLAQYLSLNDMLKFKKIDLSKNTVDGLKVSEFPTFSLYPAYSKDEPKEYYGNAVLEEFANFIKKYSNHTIDVPEIAKELKKDNSENEINSDLDETDSSHRKTSKIENDDL